MAAAPCDHKWVFPAPLSERRRCEVCKERQVMTSGFWVPDKRPESPKLDAPHDCKEVCCSPKDGDSKTADDIGEYTLVVAESDEALSTELKPLSTTGWVAVGLLTRHKGQVLQIMWKAP